MVTSLSDKLSEVVGKENVSTSKEDLTIFSHDASEIEDMPQAIVWPTDVAQVQKLVQDALRNNRHLVPRGGGTGLCGGAVGKDAIIVDMSLMNTVKDLDLKQKEVTVGAGVVLGDLNVALDGYDLFFPVIPASHVVCQVGGAISTDAAGMRAIKYGRMSDWVSWVEMVDGTGKPIRLSPEEVSATEGLLGIITEARLKLSDILENITLTVGTHEDIDRMIDQLTELKTKEPIALEFFDKHTAQLAGMKPKHHLLAEFEGEGGEITDQDRITKLKKLREGTGPALSANGYLIMEDPAIPEENMSQFLRWLKRNEIPVFGHIGIGILHPRFKPHQRELIDAMYKEVAKLGGDVSGEHGIGKAKKKYVSPDFVKRVQKLKERHDPEHVFNRGNIYDQ